jgi:hypothetical protein
MGADRALNGAPLDPVLDPPQFVPPPPADVVDAALAKAIETEVQERLPGWESRVAALADDLRARRLARQCVPTLATKARQRGA